MKHGKILKKCGGEIFFPTLLNFFFSLNTIDAHMKIFIQIPQEMKTPKCI